MLDEKCPKCQSDSMLTVQYSVLVSFDQWAWIILFFTVVLGVSFFLSMPLGFALIASWVATIPVLMKLRRKCCCERCSIEFCVTPGSGPQSGH